MYPGKTTKNQLSEHYEKHKAYYSYGLVADKKNLFAFFS